MKALLKSLINGPLGLAGLQVVHRRIHPQGLLEQCIQHAIDGIEHPLIIDVGAHEGQGLKETRAMNPNAQVLLFEPQPDVFATLQQVAARYGGTCFNMALGDQNTTLDFHAVGLTQASSLLAGADDAAITAPYLVSGQHVIKVPIRRLDDVLDEQGNSAPIDFLKIDVQGYEDRVLRGASKALARTRYVFSEFHFKAVYKDCCLIDDGFHILRQAGFRLLQTCGYNPGPIINELICADFFFVREPR